MKIKMIAGLAGGLLFFTACTNKKTEPAGMEAMPVYAEYQVWGEEMENNITVLLQFHDFNRNGETLVLNDPAKVEFDGKKLEPDSTRLTGAYYELQVPVDSFAGEHHIVFTNLNNEALADTFYFTPLTLTDSLPPAINRSDFSIGFGGVKDGDLIRVVATDTSFTSRDINEVDTISNHSISITKDQLKNLADGPVRLEFYREESRRLGSRAAARGHFTLTYGLKRQVLLK
jgi:hypothetical protein